MSHPSANSPRPLPETLLEDLRELLTWDNNCFLTWLSVEDELRSDGRQESSRWFTVKLATDGIIFSLRLEFWIPAWMDQRGVEAILPAHLRVADFQRGRSAEVDLGFRRWSDIRAALPRAARTCARLINELWGPTESDRVLLLTVEYLPDPPVRSFREVPGYGC